MQYSIIPLSYTKQYKPMRFDAEFYSKEFLAVIDKIEKKSFDFLKNVCLIRSGTTPRERDDDLKKGIVLLKTTNIRDNILTYINSENDFYYIDEETDRKMHSTRLKVNDILINIVGATTDVIGRVAVVYEDFPKANITQAMAFYRVIKDEITPEYLFLFLNSYYGKTQTKYIARPTGQYNLNLQEVGYIRIPFLSYGFQKILVRCCNSARENINKSLNLYVEAEKSLLNELNLSNWQPKHRLCFVKNHKNTNIASRTDAEYFQPMYEEIESRLKKNAECNLLEDITSLIGHPSNPPYANDDDPNKTFVITQKHLGSFFLNDNFWEDEEALYTTKDFVNRNKQFILKTDDILLYSVGAYIGKANIYNADIKATLGSFLTLIRPLRNEINPYYLLLYLNSEVGKLLTRRCSRGMAQQYVYPFDIKRFIIPLIDTTKQDAIEQKMLEALSAKQKSKEHLSLAKKAVEMAIEQSEEKAIKFLDSSLRSE